MRLYTKRDVLYLLSDPPTVRCDFLTGKHTSVADDPETLRVRKNMNTISNVAYHGEMSRKQEMENARPSEVEGMTTTKCFMAFYSYRLVTGQGCDSCNRQLLI